MSPVEKFRDSLRQLDGQMTALVTMTNLPAPPADDDLVAARWGIVRTLAELAAFQEKFLFAPMELSGNPTLATQAAPIRSAMQETMRQLIAHSERWPAQAVRKDWSGIRRALPSAHRVIRDHFAWQARIVPPMFDALAGASAAPKQN